MKKKNRDGVQALIALGLVVGGGYYVYTAAREASPYPMGSGSAVLQGTPDAYDLRGSQAQPSQAPGGDAYYNIAFPDPELVSDNGSPSPSSGKGSGYFPETTTKVTPEQLDGPGVYRQYANKVSLDVVNASTKKNTPALPPEVKPRLTLPPAKKSQPSPFKDTKKVNNPFGLRV